MPSKFLFENYRMLLLEESEIRQRLFSNWLEGFAIRPVTDPSQVSKSLNSTIAVACLCQSQLGDAEAEVRETILNVNPYCQLMLLQSSNSFSSVKEDQYDACLQRPIFKEELRETVEERLKCGVYSALLQEFYRTNAKLAGIRRSDDPPDDSSESNVEQLQRRCDDIRSKLQWLQARISDEEIHELLRSIDLHQQLLKQPKYDVPDETKSKYHPSRCPQCKLPWGVDHGGDLGTGFENVGAHVWKCKQCNEIVHGLGESHRQVM